MPIKLEVSFEAGGKGLWDIFFFSSRRRHTRFDCDWSSDVCSSDLPEPGMHVGERPEEHPVARHREVHARARERESVRGAEDRYENDERDEPRGPGADQDRKSVV